MCPFNVDVGAVPRRSDAAFQGRALSLIIPSEEYLRSLTDHRSLIILGLGVLTSKMCTSSLNVHLGALPSDSRVSLLKGFKIEIYFSVVSPLFVKGSSRRTDKHKRGPSTTIIHKSLQVPHQTYYPQIRLLIQVP